MKEVRSPDDATRLFIEDADDLGTMCPEFCSADHYRQWVKEHGG